MNESVSILWIILVQAVIAGEWLLSAQEKFLKPKFMQGIDSTLRLFADRTAFGFYKSFLKSVVIPRGKLFGNIIRISELLAAIGLAVGSVVLLAWPHMHDAASLLLIVTLFCGALLNLNLYLAAGWSGPTTTGINSIMGLTQIVLCAFFVIELLHGTVPA